MRVVLEPKLQGESRNYSFPFGSLLGNGVTILTAVVTASVYSGDDATPSAIVNGSATISGQTVTQNITAGVPGVTYQVKAAITTSDSQTLNCTAFLVVQPDVT